MSELTNVIQHPQDAVNKIATLTARIAELEGALRELLTTYWVNEDVTEFVKKVLK